MLVGLTFNLLVIEMKNTIKIKNYDNGKRLTAILLQMAYVIFNSVVVYPSYPSFYKRKGENTK